MKSFPLTYSLLFSLQPLFSFFHLLFELSWAVSLLPVLLYVLRPQSVKPLNQALDKTEGC